MNFTCNRDLLIEGITTVQKAVPTRTTMTILEGILIEVDDFLKLTGNDLEMGIEFNVPAIIEEGGSIVLNSKIFGDIIRKLPDIYVNISTNAGGLVTINSGAAHYELRSISSEGYPKVVFIDSIVGFDIKEKNLRDLIKHTIFAVSQEDTRPILKGLLIEYVDNNINFVAIDGYKLALKSFISEAVTENIKVVASSKIMNELSRILQINDDIITFCFSENQIMFYNKKYKIISKLLKGEYMNYRAMIPREFKTIVNVNCKDFLFAIERASLVMSEDRKFPLFMNFTNDLIVITANAENGFAREEVQADISGQGIEIGFNPKNIMECLKSIEEEEISLSFTTSIGPCIITSKSDEFFTYLVMPVKTR